jgi:hypothetical protein
MMKYGSDSRTSNNLPSSITVAGCIRDKTTRVGPSKDVRVDPLLAVHLSEVGTKLHRSLSFHDHNQSSHVLKRALRDGLRTDTQMLTLTKDR